MIFGFSDCWIDSQRRELTRAGSAVHVEPQVFDLLIYLIANRDRVVTKDEIFAAVWNGRIVSEATLSSRLNSARQAINDDGKAQTFIRTVPRRGFRFVGQIQEQPARPADGQVAASLSAAAAANQAVTFCQTPDKVLLAI